MNDQIEKLEQRLEKRFQQRDREKEIEYAKYENQKDVQEALQTPITDFYCKKCNCDYEDLNASPIIETDWTQKGKYLVYVNSKHKKCSTWNRRYATNKNLDPYWVKSPKMKRDQGNYYRDMIQPHESGFDMLYGRKFNQQ